MSDVWVICAACRSPILASLEDVAYAKAEGQILICTREERHRPFIFQVDTYP